MPARDWLAIYARLKGNLCLPGEHCFYDSCCCPNNCDRTIQLAGRVVV